MFTSKAYLVLCVTCYDYLHLQHSLPSSPSLVRHGQTYCHRASSLPSTRGNTRPTTCAPTRVPPRAPARPSSITLSRGPRDASPLPGASLGLTDFLVRIGRIVCLPKQLALSSCPCAVGVIGRVHDRLSRVMEAVRSVLLMSQRVCEVIDASLE